MKLPEVKKEIVIPENVTVTLENNNLTVKGEKGEISRVFSHPLIDVKFQDKKITIHSKKVRKKQKALIGTFEAHIKNMVKGVSKGFEYQMKTVFSHFPIKTAVEDEFFVIQNFLGERSPRKARILEGVTVESKGDDIKVSGIDKEKVGQTVANIERATSVKRRDIRVFQDGVYRISRGE